LPRKQKRAARRTPRHQPQAVSTCS
jgi:hypothetical protein